MSTEVDKLIAAAIRRLALIKKDHCFDADHPDSTPTPSQEAVLQDISNVRLRYCLGGNQCLPEGTGVLTPSGIINIQDIKVGDTVYDEFGKEIIVKQVFENGTKEVVELTNRGQVWAEATDNHTFLTSNSSKGGLTELKVSQFGRDTGIRRVEIDAPLGSKQFTTAYSLGALLGDGCSRQPGNQLQISSNSYHIPAKVAQQVDGTLVAPKSTYTWRIKEQHVNPAYYDEWCNNRYAHEKVVDLQEISKWDRSSVLALTAGIIDTDGSVYVDKWNNLTIRCEMQAKSVIEYLQWAFLVLWQTPVTISKNDRDKFVNGPTYSIKVANNAFSKRILHELDLELVTPHKKWKPEYSDLVSKRTNPNCIGITKGSRRLAKTYDIHVDSPTNLYCLATGLVTHNSGKSQLLRREVAWMFEKKHPYFKPPKKWQADEPWQILVVGKTRRMLEDSIWSGIRKFLTPGTYKETKVGPHLEKVTNKENGNTIIFLSHDNAAVAVDRIQSYTAHATYLDEMPTSYKIIEELQRRGQVKAGPFLASFTPKSVNIKIKKIVESAEYPIAKKYTLRAIDNPQMEDSDKEYLLESIKTFPEAVQKTILEGEWATGENAVYQFNPETMICKLPDTYHPNWRHVESSDPAVQSKFGLTLWAEDPKDGMWYCVLSEYIEGIYVPEKIFEEVMKRTEGYNVVRRVCDPHESWYIHTAASHDVHYVAPYDKNSRKAELIKGLQTALVNKIRITPACENLVEELTTCHWSETAANKIVNSSSYHLLDTAQYFVDCMPKHAPEEPTKQWYTVLREENQKRKEAKSKQAKMRVRVNPNGRHPRSWARSRRW